MKKVEIRTCEFCGKQFGSSRPSRFCGMLCANRYTARKRHQAARARRLAHA